MAAAGPTLPSCFAWLYYDRWSVSPQLWTAAAQSPPTLCVCVVVGWGVSEGQKKIEKPRGPDMDEDEDESDEGGETGNEHLEVGQVRKAAQGQ